MARRRGAPSKPVEERLRNRLMVSLTDAELAELHEAAGDTPVAVYVRETLMRHLKRRRRRLRKQED